MAPFPIARYLVPARPPEIPEGATVVSERMLAGLPHRIVVGGDTQLVVVFPTGLGTFWRDAQPTLPVALSTAETDPTGSAPASEELDSPRLYLQMRRADRTLGSRPLHAGACILLPDNGGGLTGVQYEVWCIGYALHAGTVRGPGDFGSSISLAWRRVDAATAHFLTPPLNLHALPRLLPKVVESWNSTRVSLDQPLTIQGSVKLRRSPIDASVDAINL
jgi:hypothetical protein